MNPNARRDLIIGGAVVAFGLGLFAIAYLVIDKATPFSIGNEIRDKQNVAMGVVLGCVFIGIASEGHRRHARVERIGPALIRHERRPAGPQRVLVIRVGA